MLQRFGSRFPAEFGHNKRYQRRLDELSEELRIAKEGTFAARKALMSGDAEAARKALDMHIRQQAGGASVQLLYGQIEMSDGRYEKAITHLKAALEVEPDSVEARYLLGDCHRKLDQLPEAREAFEAVLKKSPKHDSARIGLAEIQLAMGEGAKALELAQAILADAVDRKLTEQTFVAHSLLARINAQLGNAEAEKRHLLEAASIKPLDEGILLELARYLVNREQFEEARKRLESCWDKGCTSPEYFRELASVYMELSEYDRAVECVEAGLAKHKDELGLLVLSGRARMRRGDMVAAKDAYERVVALSPGQGEAYLELTNLLLETDRTDEALELLSKGVEKVTSPAPLLERLSQVYARVGQFTKARQTLAALVDRDPMNFKARLLLAEQLKSIGLVAEALPHYEFLYRNNQLQRDVRLSYADALRESRQYEQAERELGQLVQHDPSDLRARVLLGAVLVEENRFDEAEEYLRAVVAEDPLDSMAQYYLGRLMLSRDKQKEALQFFGRAMGGKDPLPEYRFEFGQTLLAIGGRKNYSEAVNAFSGIINRYEDGKATGGVFERMCDVYLSRGEARMKLLKFDDALEDFEKAMHIDPLRADAVTAVAAGLIKKRRYKEAERYLNMVIEENPHYAEAHYQLGLLFVRRSEKKKARKHFHAAVAEDELSFPLAYRHLGFLYREKRMDREARLYFKKYLSLAGDEAIDREDIERLLGID